MSVIEVGHFCLILASICSLLQISGLFVHIFPLDFVKTVARVQFICLVISLLSLTYAYIYSDFSVLNVINNSHTDKPLIYKISGVWGNHEGSMLLWALILSGFGALMTIGQFTNPHIRSRAIGIQGGIGFLITVFIIFTSSPFTRIFPPAAQGRDLNPLLQDIGLAIHPPMLYMGYVGFSAVFSVAIACLLTAQVGRSEGNLIHRWCRIAWMFLTGGIGLGMWWAYYELGWGGFWFWDPVENASLMPWLAGTALLHSSVMLAKRDILKKWVILLSIICFSSSLLGTFIVRSGIVTSVHSFASSPERGIFILVIAFLCIGGALVTYILRGDRLESKDDYKLFSREGALILNNYFLSGILFIVFMGTLYPSFLEAINGERISVGAPYFNSTLAPIFYLLVFVLPLAGLVSWKRGKLQDLKQPLLFLFIFMLGALCIFWLRKLPISAWGLMICAVWIIIGTILEMIMRTRGDIKMIIHILKSETAKFSAHLGLALVLIGITGISILKSQQSFVIDQNKNMTINHHQFIWNNQVVKQEQNYQVERSTVSYDNLNNASLDTINFYPERRFYPTTQQITTEADIRLFWDQDIYVTAGETTPKGKKHINIRIHPYAGFLWAGMILAFVGMGCALIMPRLKLSSASQNKEDLKD